MTAMPHTNYFFICQLLLLLASYGICRVSNQNKWKSLIQPEGPFGIRLYKRQSTGSLCRAVCSASACNGCLNARRRSLPSNDIFNVTEENDNFGHSLQKRVLVGTPANIDSLPNYFTQQSQKTGYQGICPRTPDSELYNPTFCVEQQFSTANLNGGQWLAGSGDTLLTVLTVVSARSVYMCHFYEDLNYAGDNDAPPIEGFQPVIDLIEGTAPGGQYTAGVPLTPALYNNDNDYPLAAIMTPRAEQPPHSGIFPVDTMEYQNEYNQLVASLIRLIPGLTILNYPYEPPTVPSGEFDDDGNEIFKYAADYQGQALFEYDNDADGQGTPDWRLWYEQANERGRMLGQVVASNA